MSSRDINSAALKQELAMRMHVACLLLLLSCVNLCVKGSNDTTLPAEEESTITSATTLEDTDSEINPVDDLVSTSGMLIQICKIESWAEIWALGCMKPCPGAEGSQNLGSPI